MTDLAELTVVTVGHGTLAEDEFAAVTTGAEVEHVVDVRSFPGSRRHPHFARDAMEEWLPAAGVGYSWEPRLGGRRKTVEGTKHVALRVDGFRAYADHMETEEFGAGLGELLRLAAEQRTAVMCAESVWWRCHRMLLSDALVQVHGVAVEHLMHDGRLDPHRPRPEARVEELSGGGRRLVYDVGETPPMV